MEESGSTETDRIMDAYGAYLKDVFTSISGQKETLERLYALMKKHALDPSVFKKD